MPTLYNALLNHDLKQVQKLSDNNPRNMGSHFISSSISLSRENLAGQGRVLFRDLAESLRFEIYATFAPIRPKRR